MGPTEAARILLAYIQRHTDATPKRHIGMGLPATLTALTAGLTSVLDQLGPTEAARTAGVAARIIVSALERYQAGGRPDLLASALASVVDRMDPVDASRLCEEAIGISMQVRAEDLQEWNRNHIDFLVARLLRSLDSKTAKRRAHDLCMLMMGEWKNGMGMRGMMGLRGTMGMTGSFGSSDPETFRLVLADDSREQTRLRAARMAAAAGPGLEGALEAAARISAEPRPCRLSTQDLVELLKMPTCIGAARQIVLDHLGNRHGWRFVNHWAFVRYATEQKLKIDFTTPPKRPDPKQILSAMLGQRTDRLTSQE
jgi:hypothetical protein